MTLSRVNNTVIRWGAVAPGLTGASWVVMRQIISNDTPPGLTDAEHPRNEKVFYCHFSTGMCKEIFKYSAII
jgi:hypothetical protein